ncbi:hypothetical protein Csa_015388 [Cucumis sativus]|nr:hypothetical protein Csa_015388 [Cucumis sativus]
MATSTTNLRCILQKIIQPHWKQQHRIERVAENKIGRGRRWLLKIRHLEVGATHWHSMTKENRTMGPHRCSVPEENETMGQKATKKRGWPFTGVRCEKNVGGSLWCSMEKKRRLRVGVCSAEKRGGGRGRVCERGKMWGKGRR